MIGIDWRRLANRAALLAASIVVVNGLAVAQVASAPSAAPTTIDTSSATPLPRDPHVIVGTLPNGLRYYIRKNAKPEKRAELRLVVNAGSILEDDDQRGLAHFLEHMAFEGSQNLAPGELVAFLQRAGLAFGPDTNASTTFDQTVYQLDLPRDDPQLLDQSLGILSEIAGRLSLPPAEIETERGVILSEKRTRDTTGQRSGDAMIDFLLPGSRYAERTPIGLESVIRTAPRDELLAFYHNWYRPERQIVIVTGDVQPAAVEELIERHFGNLAPSGPAPEPPPADRPMAHPLAAAMFTDPGLPASVALNLVLPFDDRPDSLAKQSDRLRELLAGMMLQRRLDSLLRRRFSPVSRLVWRDADSESDVRYVVVAAGVADSVRLSLSARNAPIWRRSSSWMTSTLRLASSVRKPNSSAIDAYSFRSAF